MGASEASGGEPYLVFLLDGAPTPTFDYRLEAARIHRVPGGWWMTHLKHIGLGRDGGSVSSKRVIGTIQRNQPMLRTTGFLDFGAIIEDEARQVRGVAEPRDSDARPMSVNARPDVAMSG